MLSELDNLAGKKVKGEVKMAPREMAGRKLEFTDKFQLLRT
jgi:hypothetical protein